MAQVACCVLGWAWLLAFQFLGDWLEKTLQNYSNTTLI
jgi:putative effector of murein hydrolase LrgA (UPF0299 family)